MTTKRGQAAPAAVLLAIIMGLVIMFIMLVPPSERAKILEEDSNGTDSSVFGEKTLLEVNPGRLSYIKDKTFEKAISSVHVFTEEKSTILAEQEYLTVKNALFSSETKNIYFGVDDLANTNDLLLSFTIDSYQGDLIILLNDKEIFNKETHMIKPLKLSKSLLSSDNVLTFKVSSPGAAFWRTNFYELEKVMVVADVIDVSNRKSKSLFNIDEDDFKNLEKITLRFNPDTTCTSEDGKLDVQVNDYAVFSGVPECDVVSYYELPKEELLSGSNWVSFETDEGNYLIDQIAVKLRLKDPSYPVYYFTVDDKYFTNDTEDDKELKKDYDVLMALEFADDDKKEADVYVNGHKIGFDTYKIEFSHKLDSYLEPWTNSIKIIPQNSFDLKTLKVVLKD